MRCTQITLIFYRYRLDRDESRRSPTCRKMTGISSDGRAEWRSVFLVLAAATLSSSGTVSSIRLTTRSDWEKITMSGLCRVAAMSIGMIE